MTIGLACRDLGVGWPKRSLLEGVAFVLDPLPACLPIIGQTGIGKSTLLYVLSGMALPRAGTIEWRLPRTAAPDAGQADADHVAWSGPDGEGYSRAAHLRASRFGFVLQDAELISCFTVAENIEHALRLRGVSESRAKRRDRIRRKVEVMRAANETLDGSGGLLGKYPTELSGGTRKRMAIAAAVAHDPTILFADEPTSGLDDPTGLSILTSIRRWLLEDGFAGRRGFICVTHQLEILARGFRQGGVEQVIDVARPVSTARPGVELLGLAAALERQDRRVDEADGRLGAQRPVPPPPMIGAA